MLGPRWHRYGPVTVEVVHNGQHPPDPVDLGRPYPFTIAPSRLRLTLTFEAEVFQGSEVNADAIAAAFLRALKEAEDGQ